MAVASGNTNTDILIAGAFAALSIDLLIYPLDTIKTRIQAPNYAQLFTKANGTIVDRALYRGLYQGVFSVILVTVPSSGAFFTTYEASKSLLTNLNTTLLPASTQLPTPLIHSTASAIAEAISCTILTPAEVIKQNAQILKQGPNHNHTHRSAGISSSSSSSSSTTTTTTTTTMASATRKALAKFSHPSQLWRGYSVLLARNLPFTAMQFPLFEGLKVRLLEWRGISSREGSSSSSSSSSSSNNSRSRSIGSVSGNGDNSEIKEESLLERGLVTALAAGISGSFAAVVTTPVDVVKTRVMLHASSSSSSSSSSSASTESGGARERQNARNNRKGGFAIGKEIWRQDGIRGLFRGGLLRGVWTALGSGLYLSVYESGRQFLEDRRKDSGDDL